MDKLSLIQNLTDYGADVYGINNRFTGNYELYSMCFDEMLKDENFKNLEKGIEKKDYLFAFECAHALKGLLGNLGLTPIYNLMCSLVESLRNNEFFDIERKYALIKDDFQRLKMVFGVN